MRLNLIAVLLLTIAACTGVVAGTMPGTGFDVIRYAVTLTPDIGGKRLVGSERIELRSTTSDLRRLVFSGNALHIDDARLDDQPARVTREEGQLVFLLDEGIAEGRTATLSLSFHGKPARGFAGSATTLYTSYFVCDWMICLQDQTGDKALFELDLQVPEGMGTLSVGRRTDTRPGMDALEIHRWRTTSAYSSYLFGFAVGHFVRTEQRVGRSKLVVLSDTADASELQRRFADTKAMVRFLSDRAGLPLPAGGYTQLLVAGGEAQEAATYSVLGTESVPVEPGDATQDWAIAHELAHQWWGNLVTCATRKDFWLNEGVTTFMTAAWKEHRYGRAAYEAELDVARARLAKATDIGFDKPLAWGGMYPSLGIRRAIQYSKGALFMDHLRGELGERAFWSGLRRYTREHAGAVVTSVDLQRAMERSSRRDLNALFSTWVFGYD